MYKKLKNQQGFTIIEVMIVLAIAGLILLIVFLAVPALQRSARNTQRKNDASAISGAVNTYVNNNNGVLPDQAAFAAPKLTFYFKSAKGADASSVATVGYYKTISTPITGKLSKTGVTTDQITVFTGASCNGNVPVASVNQGSAYTVVWGVETGSGLYASNCIQ